MKFNPKALSAALTELKGQRFLFNDKATIARDWLQVNCEATDSVRWHLILAYVFLSGRLSHAFIDVLNKHPVFSSSQVSLKMFDLKSARSLIDWQLGLYFPSANQGQDDDLFSCAGGFGGVGKQTVSRFLLRTCAFDYADDPSPHFAGMRTPVNALKESTPGLAAQQPAQPEGAASIGEWRRKHRYNPQALRQMWEGFEGLEAVTNTGLSPKSIHWIQQHCQGTQSDIYLFLLAYIVAVSKGNKGSVAIVAALNNNRVFGINAGVSGDNVASRLLHEIRWSVEAYNVHQQESGLELFNVADLEKLSGLQLDGEGRITQVGKILRSLAAKVDENPAFFPGGREYQLEKHIERLHCVVDYTEGFLIALARCSSIKTVNVQHFVSARWPDTLQKSLQALSTSLCEGVLGALSEGGSNEEVEAQAVDDAVMRAFKLSSEEYVRLLAEHPGQPQIVQLRQVLHVLNKDSSSAFTGRAKQNLAAILDSLDYALLLTAGLKSWRKTAPKIEWKSGLWGLPREVGIGSGSRAQLDDMITEIALGNVRDMDHDFMMLLHANEFNNPIIISLERDARQLFSALSSVNGEQPQAVLEGGAGDYVGGVASASLNRDTTAAMLSDDALGGAGVGAGAGGLPVNVQKSKPIDPYDFGQMQRLYEDSGPKPDVSYNASGSSATVVGRRTVVSNAPSVDGGLPAPSWGL